MKKLLVIAAFVVGVAAPALAQNGDWDHAVSLFNQKQTRAAWALTASAWPLRLW